MMATTTGHFARGFAYAALFTVGLAATAVGEARAASILTENFDTLPVGGGGWTNANNSAPSGTTGWFQGNAGVFTAQQGPADSYAAANFLGAAFGGNISNWLITPVVPLANGNVLTFYTRSDPAGFADRLQVRLSSNGASTDVGTTDTSVGDFTNLLLDINPTLDPSGYTGDWTLYSLTLSGLSGSVTGRLAFRYFVTDTNTNGNYIGLDTLSLDAAAVTPIPASLPLLASGLGVLVLMARHRKRQAA